MKSQQYHTPANGISEEIPKFARLRGWLLRAGAWRDIRSMATPHDLLRRYSVTTASFPYRAAKDFARLLTKLVLFFPCSGA